MTLLDQQRPRSNSVDAAQVTGVAITRPTDQNQLCLRLAADKWVRLSANAPAEQSG